MVKCENCNGLLIINEDGTDKFFCKSHTGTPELSLETVKAHQTRDLQCPEYKKRVIKGAP